MIPSVLEIIKAESMAKDAIHDAIRREVTNARFHGDAIAKMERKFDMEYCDIVRILIGTRR